MALIWQNSSRAILGHSAPVMCLSVSTCAERCMCRPNSLRDRKKGCKTKMLNNWKALYFKAYINIINTKILQKIMTD